MLSPRFLQLHCRAAPFIRVTPCIIILSLAKRKAFNRKLRIGIETDRDAVPALRKDGTRNFYRVHGLAVHDDAGRIFDIAAMLHDPGKALRRMKALRQQLAERGAC
jgi:hypothetical protein